MQTAPLKGLTLKAISTSDGATFETFSADETLSLGRLFGESLPPGACLALFGELGAGKTVFAKGLIRGLGVSEAIAVTSPTFIIVSEYTGRLPIHHIDAYRLKSERDIIDLGSRELMFHEAVSIIEWADRIIAAIPDDRLEITFMVTGPTARRIDFAPKGPLYADLLKTLLSRVSV